MKPRSQPGTSDLLRKLGGLGPEWRPSLSEKGHSLSQKRELMVMGALVKPPLPRPPACPPACLTRDLGNDSASPSRQALKQQG